MDQHEIDSRAIGQRIEALRYDTDAGYVVIELESGEDLWVSSDAEGHSVFVERTTSESVA